MKSLIKDICALGGAVTILAALITGGGDIISSIGSELYKNYYTEKSAFPIIEILSVESISPPGYEFSDKNGRHADPPYIDITLFNRGKSAGIITRLDLMIISGFLNTTPVLSSCNFNRFYPCYNNTIQAEITNLGWGPARELEWKSKLDLGEFTKKLNLSNNQFNWTGNISAGETLIINFVFRAEDGYLLSFSNDTYFIYKGNIYKQKYVGRIFTEVNYNDTNMVEYYKHFEDYIYLYEIDNTNLPMIFNRISMSSMGSNFAASIIDPVEIFYIDSIDPEMNCPSNMSFYVHHFLEENQVDRIILKINSTKKSGKIKYKVIVISNSEAPTISEVKDMEWVTANTVKNIKYNNIIV